MKFGSIDNFSIFSKTLIYPKRPIYFDEYFYILYYEIQSVFCHFYVTIAVGLKWNGYLKAR